MSVYRSLSAMLLLAGCAVAVPATADEISELRSELQALKAEYARRVQSLEERIDQLETQLSAAEALGPDAPVAEAAPALPTPAPGASGAG